LGSRRAVFGPKRTSGCGGSAPRALCWMGSWRGLLALLAGLPFEVGGEHGCPGVIDLPGYGRVSLVNARWNVPGEAAPEIGVKVLNGGFVEPHMGGRTYFAEACTPGIYDHSQYVAMNLLGKTMRYTTDLSSAGCGCNAALYLTSLRQNDRRSECGDYYCDASSVCGVACAEIDLQEANLHSWHTTLHAYDDRGGQGVGIGGGGLKWNGFREWTSADYGLGGRCIDTSAPFNVAISFPVDEAGVLTAVEVTLSQSGRPCNLSAKISEYNFNGRNGMKELSAALDAGMAPIISYWSSDEMLWLDGKGADHKGVCALDSPGQCPDSVKFYDFSIARINQAPSMATTNRRTTTEEPSPILSIGTPAAPGRPKPCEAGREAFYREKVGRLAAGHFTPGSDSCHGMGECQFRTLGEAQAFCDRNAECTTVVLHPFHEDCAGGFGCYTPRSGPDEFNELLDRIGGRAWVKESCDSMVDEAPAAPLPPPPQGPSPGPLPGPPQEIHLRRSLKKNFEFVGFAGRADAARACGAHRRLASARNFREQVALEAALQDAFTAGRISGNWPKNTIWLGGHWSRRLGQWRWDDGIAITRVNWAQGQPSTPGEQSREPYLCMQLHGEVHDTDLPHEFGVMCEDGEASWLPDGPPLPPSQELSSSPKHVMQSHATGGHSRYQMVGFARRSAALAACGHGGRLAAPKSVEEMSALQRGIAREIAEGRMEQTWPNNTVWLGAHWDAAKMGWTWADGSDLQEINWAAGQPSSAGNQELEAFLCITNNGEVHDSDGPYEFGVMCEYGPVQETFPLRKLQDAKFGKFITPSFV